MKHFSSFLLSITCALSLNFFGMHAAVLNPEKIDFDPTQVFDRIIEQGGQEQIYNAAHTLLIMESLLECYFAEKLAVPHNMDSVEWDIATTELLDTLEAMYEKMNPEVKDAFDVLDAHFENTKPRFNFHDFMQLVNIRRELTLAFWEYVDAFEQFKKELTPFDLALSNLKCITPQTIAKLRALCTKWKMNNCEQSILPQITCRLSPDVKYLDAKAIIPAAKVRLEYEYDNFVRQFVIIEKLGKRKPENAVNKICKLGSNIKETSRRFFDFYDTVAATFPKLQQNYPTIYMQATYFKSISSKLYKKLYCALNPENRMARYGVLRGKPLPLEIFVINSVLSQSDIQQYQILHQAFVQLIALKQKFDQITITESVPSSQQATQPCRIKGCDLDDGCLMQQLYIEYLRGLSHIERENPVIFQQINHLALWRQLHAIDLVNCLLVDRMNRQITSTAKYICDYKRDNGSWPEDKIKRINMLAQIIYSMQQREGCETLQLSDLQSRISDIVSLKISRFLDGNTEELQNPEYNDAYPMISIPSNRLMPTINYYEQLIRQNLEDLISARDAVQAVPAPQSSREEQARQVFEPKPHTSRKAPKPKTKKHKEDAAPSPLPAQAISPVDEKQKEAEVSAELVVAAAPRPQVDDELSGRDEYVVYRKPERFAAADRPKFRSHKSVARPDSPQTLNDYLQTILSQPLFNCDHVREADDFIAIRQQQGGLWGNGMMLIIYKEQENQDLACVPFTTFQLAEKQSGDTFHKFSDRVETFCRYGMDLNSEQLAVTQGIHQSFIEKLYLQADERVIIIRGKIINNRFYRCEQAMQDKNASRPGMHDGAFVYIYNPKTGVCKHRCFHETTASYIANHEYH